jgi:hypothetical protein
VTEQTSSSAPCERYSFFFPPSLSGTFERVCCVLSSAWAASIQRVEVARVLQNEARWRLEGFVFCLCQHELFLRPRRISLPWRSACPPFCYISSNKAGRSLGRAPWPFSLLIWDFPMFSPLLVSGFARRAPIIIRTHAYSLVLLIAHRSLQASAQVAREVQYLQIQ